MQNTTIQPSVNTSVDTITSSQKFLEAVLYKDAKVLRSFGVDDNSVQAITLDKQIEVAMKLLAADNNLKRSLSKRVMAAQVLGDKETVPATTAQAGKQATFQTTATFNPSPSKSLKAA